MLFRSALQNAVSDSWASRVLACSPPTSCLTAHLCSFGRTFASHPFAPPPCGDDLAVRLRLASQAPGGNVSSRKTRHLPGTRARIFNLPYRRLVVGFAGCRKRPPFVTAEVTSLILSWETKGFREPPHVGCHFLNGLLFHKSFQFGCLFERLQVPNLRNGRVQLCATGQARRA